MGKSTEAEILWFIDQTFLYVVNSVLTSSMRFHSAYKIEELFEERIPITIL